MTRWLRRAVALACLVVVCSAHIGSPDAWYEGPAGPYRVLVHIETPAVVPGIAVVNVRPEGATVERVTAFVNKFDATGGAPPPDVATPAPDSPGWYRTRLWVMSAGSNSVTVTIHGARGMGSAVVPLVAVAGRRLSFNRPLASVLIAAGVVLALGLFTIVGAAVRESVLPPGEEPDARRRRRARFAMGRAIVVFILAMTGSAAWWRAEDATFRRGLFRPLQVAARVDASRRRPELVLSIEDSAWVRRERLAWLRARGEEQFVELVEDHGKLMHLFVVAEDGRSAFAHLHPDTRDTVTFNAALPPLPAGKYRVFADIVQASGFTQTLTAPLHVPSDQVGTRWDPAPDDSWAIGSALGDARTATVDSLTITWLRGASPVVARQEAGLRFAVAGQGGAPAQLEPYLGMAGHAVVVRNDGQVFIHLHPLGTISVAAQARLMASTSDSTAHTTHNPTVNAADTVYFPYAFPEPGEYTVWVQVKRAGRIVTGSFPVQVAP